MNKSSWYLVGGLAVLLLSIPAYVLYRSSHDMVDTLAPEETQAENQPGFSDLCVRLVFMRLSRSPPMKVLAAQEVRSPQSASSA